MAEVDRGPHYEKRPKPKRCEECRVRTSYLYWTKVDVYGRHLWLCGRRNYNCFAGCKYKEK